MATKILIDLQGVQTPNAAGRGIGRYSEQFVRSSLECFPSFEFILLVNENYLSKQLTILLEKFENWKNISVHYWRPLPRTGFLNMDSFAREASKSIYTFAIENLKPDLVVVLSPFEGLTDDALFTVQNTIPTCAIFYDAIPFIYKEKYLSNKDVLKWYMETVAELRKCISLFAISKSAGNDAVKYLNLELEKITTLKIGLSTDFSSRINHDSVNSKRTHYLLSVLGEDQRKNKIGLLEAFKILKEKYLTEVKLQIVYKQSGHEERANKEILKQMNLQEDVEFLGYVPDSKLMEMYRNCSLFVFPSFYEGLGLPVLEAFAAGAPVVCSNTSSLPEVLPDSRFTFDPNSPEDMARVINETLQIERLREENLKIGALVVQEFDMDNSNRILRTNVEKTLKQLSKAKHNTAVSQLNFVTPLPPIPSGIADYSVSMITALNEELSMRVITDTTKADKALLLQMQENQIEVVDIKNHKTIQNLDGTYIYNFGNSEYHIAEYELFRMKPGVVILHDFYLSGLNWSLKQNHLKFENFYDALYQVEGIGPLVLRDDTSAVHHAIINNPMNRLIVENALGIVVFSEHNKKQLQNNFVFQPEQCIKIPLIRSPHTENSPGIARKSSDHLMVAVFGIIADTKCYSEILESWKNLPRSFPHKLIFVGEDLTTDLQKKISNLELEESVVITGRVSRKEYEDYLRAASIAIQLRKNSRGETSGALLDVLAHGIPTITNLHGSNSEVPTGVVVHISEKINIAELTNTLAEIISNKEKRKYLSANAVQYIRTEHSPKNFTDEFLTFLENLQFMDRFERMNASYLTQDSNHLSNSSRIKLRHSFASSMNEVFTRRRVILDLSQFYAQENTVFDPSKLRELIEIASKSWPNYWIQVAIFDTERNEFVDAIDVARQISGKNLQGVNRLINMKQSDILVTSLINNFRSKRVIRVPSIVELKDYFTEYKRAIE